MGYIYLSPVCIECLLYNEEEECLFEENEGLECKLTLLNGALSLYRCRLEQVDLNKQVGFLSGREEDQQRFKKEMVKRSSVN